MLISGFNHLKQLKTKTIRKHHPGDDGSEQTPVPLTPPSQSEGTRPSLTTSSQSFGPALRSSGPGGMSVLRRHLPVSPGDRGRCEGSVRRPRKERAPSRLLAQQAEFGPFDVRNRTIVIPRRSWALIWKGRTLMWRGLGSQIPRF